MTDEEDNTREEKLSVTNSVIDYARRKGCDEKEVLTPLFAPVRSDGSISRDKRYRQRVRKAAKG